jgi:predicted metal-dependent phosphoesterase TrpH
MTTVRAAAHVHSEWSYDASWALEALAQAFARRRYDVVLMAEHDRGFDAERWQGYREACAAASDGRILLVPGMEYEDADNVVHVAVWGEAAPYFGHGRETLETLEDARSAGCTAVFAHPWRRDASTRFRPEWAPLLSAVEIWNRHYDGVAPSREGLRLSQEHGLAPFVSLDFHTRRQFFPLAMELEVDGALTASAVYAALAAGRFRPAALRMSALRFTHGAPGATARGLERARRAVRGPLRKLENAVRR